jgi:hypothetical protein
MSVKDLEKSGKFLPLSGRARRLKRKVNGTFEAIFLEDFNQNSRILTACKISRGLPPCLSLGEHKQLSDTLRNRGPRIDKGDAFGKDLTEFVRKKRKVGTPQDKGIELWV